VPSTHTRAQPVGSSARAVAAAPRQQQRFCVTTACDHNSWLAAVQSVHNGQLLTTHWPSAVPRSAPTALDGDGTVTAAHHPRATHCPLLLPSPCAEAPGAAALLQRLDLRALPARQVWCVCADGHSCRCAAATSVAVVCAGAVATSSDTCCCCCCPSPLPPSPPPIRSWDLHKAHKMLLATLQW
jgi:hypothetical protein